MWLRLTILILVLPGLACATEASAAPPATTRAAPEGALDSVDKLLASGERMAAIRLFARVADATKADDDPQYTRRLMLLRARVNQAADELLDETDQLLTAGAYAAAADRLHDLLSTMAGLPTASLARQRLAGMVAKPQVQEYLQTRRRQDAADAALDEARSLRDAGKEQQAYEWFRSVASDYVGTRAALAASAALRLYDADESFTKRLRDSAAAPKAKAALNIADNYRSAGLLDRAKTKYREVIDQFPGTTFADDARTRLSAMK